MEKKLSIVYAHNQRLMVGRAHDVMIMKTCHAIASGGHTVRIITGRFAKKEDIFRYYGLREISNLKIIQVPMLRGRHFSWHGLFNLFCFLKILDLKKKGLADIIYLREVKLARFLLRFRKLMRVPCVIEVHDLKIKKFYGSRPERDKNEEYVFNRVEGIAILLNTFGNVLRDTYDLRNIPLVKIPLAAEKTSVTPQPSGGRMVGYIGQLYPMQGIDILMEAMTYLPDASLSIIGGGEKELSRLKKLAADKGIAERVIFHGFVQPDLVPEKARDMDVMVICALNRGKRRYSAHTKLYEYLAMGKPIVAVDLPSVTEEVTNDINVVIARPEDPRDLAEKIALVLNNHELSKSLAASAYKLADEFTWEKRAKKISDLFQNVCENYQN